MKPVNLYASLPHYLDHLAPLWRGLAPAERGHVYCANGHTVAYARQLGLDPLPRTYPQYPHGPRRTAIDGHLPDVLVASWRDHNATGRARTVYVEHGAGQTYLDDPHLRGMPDGPGKRRVRLFVVPGRMVANRCADAYPTIPVVAVGCPKLDDHLTDGQPDHGGTPVVAFTWHWEPRDCCPERRTALPHWEAVLGPLAASLTALGCAVVGHAHPRAWNDLAPLYGRLGITTERSHTAVLDRADLLVADNTSALYEHAALDRPVVLLDAPWYRRDVEHGLRFWSHACIGPRVGSGSADELRAAIVGQLERDEWAACRRRLVGDVYAHADGHSAERAVQAMRDHCP